MRSSYLLSYTRKQVSIQDHSLVMIDNRDKQESNSWYVYKSNCVEKSCKSLQLNIVTPLKWLENELCLAIVTIVCDCKLCWGEMVTMVIGSISPINCSISILLCSRGASLSMMVFI